MNLVLVGVERSIKNVVEDKKMFLPVLTTLLFFFSFPKFGCGYFAWIMFVPWFYKIYKFRHNNRTTLYVFKKSLLIGLLLYSGIFYWVVPTFQVAGESIIVGILSMLFLSLYCSLYFAIFCIFLFPSISMANVLKMSSLWVLLEIIRGNILSGFPWMLVGYSQYKFLPLIQVAKIGGIYIVSFLVIITNLIIANIIFGLVNRTERNKVVSLGVFLAFLLTIVLVYGVLELKSVEKNFQDVKDKVRVVLLQGNIDQYKKWDKNYYNEILSSYEDVILSSVKNIEKETGSDKINLFIWPESSLPGWVLEEKELSLWLKSLIEKTNSYHVVGCIFYDEEKEMDKYYNGALLFSPKFEILQKYKKIHLVPFGEYVPFRKILARFVNTINELGEFTAGKEFTVFKVKHNNLDIKFSTLICYESIFPELTSKFVRNGATLLVNITNDAWYLKTSAPYQLFVYNVFRAVENGVYVVRSANTGISGVISPTGEVIRQSKIFVRDSIIFDLPLYHKDTFYSKYFWLVPWLFSILFIFGIALESRKNSKNGTEENKV